MISANNESAAAQVYSMHTRIILLVNTMSSCALMLVSSHVLAIMGPQYAGSHRLLVVMVLLQGLANPATMGGTLLASVGKQQFAALTGVLHGVILTPLIFVLWRYFGFAGAVVAYGSAALICNNVMLAAARHQAPFYPSFTRSYLKMATVLTVTGITCLLAPSPGLLAATLAWIIVVLAFLTISGYSYSDCVMLIQHYVPLLSRSVHGSGVADSTMSPVPEVDPKKFLHDGDDCAPEALNGNSPRRPSSGVLVACACNCGSKEPMNR
jgi:O-antigen/teichoic acid export membrane protein